MVGTVDCPKLQEGNGVAVDVSFVLMELKSPLNRLAVGSRLSSVSEACVACDPRLMVP